jgi:hypothetical protein
VFSGKALNFPHFQFPNNPKSSLNPQQITHKNLLKPGRIAVPVEEFVGTQPKLVGILHYKLEAQPIALASSCNFSLARH